jgi:hypothetical protein
MLVSRAASASPPTAVPQARCAAADDAWNVVRGTLVTGASCGDLVASTDASDTRIYIAGLFRHVSLARIAYREPIAAPFELTMEWQWLTPGRWTLEIHGLGTVVLLGPDTIGFYVDDAQLMGDMFQELPTVAPRGTQHISIRQTAHEIVVSVDGKVVGRRAVQLAKSSGTLMLGIRGAPGERTRGAIRSLRVRSLSSS